MVCPDCHASIRPRRALALLLVLLSAPALWALRVPERKSPLADKSFAEDRLFPSGWSVELDRNGALDNQSAWLDYLEANPRARVFIDQHTQNPAVISGRLEEWVPGAGNDLTLAHLGMGPQGPIEAPDLDRVRELAERYLDRHADKVVVDRAHLSFNEEHSGLYFGRIWIVHYDYVIDGIPVEGAFVRLIANQGNLNKVHTRHVLPHPDVIAVPNLDSAEVVEILEGYVGGFGSSESWFEVGKPRISFIPVTRDSIDRPGIEYQLVYRVTYRESPYGETWELTVDARTGRVLSFLDENRYATVDGGVWPISWRVGGVTQSQEIRPMPYVETSQCGTTDLSGKFVFCGAANNQMVGNPGLDGLYVTTNDNCGGSGVALDDDGSNNFPLGTSGDPGPGDCATTGGMPAWNTASSREQFYHVNLIKEKGRSFYPGNGWLQADLTANVNINNTCNAFWNGSTINFYRSGSGCGNTGEEISVSLHEWGHGFDDNSGGGGGAQGTGEAMGDTFGMSQSHASCVGWGFLPSNCGGYGNACTNCDGVRDVDWAAHSMNVPLAPQDNWQGNTGSGIADGSGYECSLNAGYRGPCGREGHCESYPMSMTNWDIATRDLPAWGMTSAQAWDWWDKLWWESRVIDNAGYQCPGNNENTADGCNAGSYWEIYLMIDDADGDPSNGTPHASAIFNAAFRHGIHCLTAGDPENMDNPDGCPSLSAPVLTSQDGFEQVALNWTSVAGADAYRVMRNELGCSAGFTEIATVTGLSYIDLNVANGITYYYTIVPEANAGACGGDPSNCVVGDPIFQPNVSYLAGSAVVVSETGGDNDGWFDNCETLGIQVTLINDGTSTVNNPRVVGVTAANPSVSLVTAMPVVAPGSLAQGATTTATFEVAIGAGIDKASAGEILDFTIETGCDECTATALRNFSFTAEQDWALSSLRTWDFTAGFDGWTQSLSSNFSLSTARPSPGSGGNALHGTPAQAACDANPGAGNGACDSARSPLLQLSGAGPWTLTVPSWYQIEGPSGQDWDRANIHLIDAATNTHILATPTGRTYNGTGDDAGLCHINNQLGFVGCAGTSWANSLVDLGSHGFSSGDRLWVELNYNTDGLVTSEGIYFDDVSLNDVEIPVPDAQPDVCCIAPPAPVLNPAVDQGGNQIDLSWSAVGIAESYNVYRADGSCPGGGFVQIATGVIGTTYSDTTVSGGSTYAYHVRAWDDDESCESLPSNCEDVMATGTCLLPPSFAGLTSATNTLGSTCTIDLAWSAGSSNCAGGLTYDVHRSTSSGFTPSPANRIATGVAGTAYSDSAGLADGTTYFYVVRAVDTVNGDDDGNTVERQATPSGPSVVVYSHDFESGAGGWFHSAPNTTATTGVWGLGDPDEVIDGGVTTQPEDDHTPAGTDCFFTEPNTGGVGTNDVDGGVSTGFSPIIDLSAYANAQLSMWYFHGQRDTGDDPAGDYFRIDLSNDGGATFPFNLVLLGDAAHQANWTEATADLNALFGGPPDQLVIRYQASDGPTTGDLVEGGIDDVTITTNQLCTTAAAGPHGVPDGNLVAGTPLTAQANGSNVDIAWDPGCGSTEYVVYSGAIGDFANVTGAAGCALGTSGSATVPMAAGEWFVVTGIDGVADVASFGRDSTGAQRPLAGWQGVCSGINNQNLSGSCN